MTTTDSETRQPRDLARIDVYEQWEVQWWATRFNVTPEELHSAVREVGPDAAEVERKLKQAAKASFQNMGED